MDEENKDVASEVLESTETVAEETTEETPEVEVAEVPQTDEEKEELRKENEDLKKKNSQLYERVKKGDKVPSKDAPMSLADATALLKADVHEDDIERVEKFAKSEGVSVREALKSDELKAILGVRAEKRSTANAANISNVRRGPSKVSDEVLISNANSGKLPDSDEDIARLIAAKAKRKD